MKQAFGFRDPFGFTVSVHQSTLHLVIILFGLFAAIRGEPIGGLIVIGTLLVSIYLHEVGHGLGCRSRGVAVKGLVIHGGGGLCLYEPAGPRDEVTIIAAGPLATLALCLFGAAAAAALRAAGAPPALAGHMAFLAEVNLLLLIFNLLPVLPLDGGRLLYLGLWRSLPQARALRLTGLIGLVVALLWWPMAILVFLSFGYILFFSPSIRDNWRRWKGPDATPKAQKEPTP